MARTVYFLDGSSEVFFGGDSQENLALFLTYVIEKRLGRDAADLLQELLDPEQNGMAGKDQELICYELSCESYRTCLQETLAHVERLLRILSAHRIDRRKFIAGLERIKTGISNEL